MFPASRITLLVLLFWSMPVFAIENVLVEKDIVFKEVEGTELRLSITRPENSMNEDLPLILFIHGGSWYHRSYNDQLSYMKQFAETGDFVLASAEYRFSPRSTAPSAEIWPAQIEDCQDALDFLLTEENASKYGIDTSRVGTWGYSAGGHLSNLLAVQNPDTLACQVSYSGPTDMELLLESDNTYSDVKYSVEQLLGGTLADPGVRDLAISASPVTYLSPNSPPTLLVQSTGDPWVNKEQAITYHDQAQAIGADTTLQLWSGVTHGMFCFYRARFNTLEYFYDHLTDGGNPYQNTYHASFESSEGYAGSSALPGTNLIGQDGWVQGGWGTDGHVTVKTVPTMDDTKQAVRLGTTTTTPAGSVSAYKEFTSTPLSEGAVEVWCDLQSYGLPEGMFAIGDINMTFDEAIDESLITDGIAAMFGTMSNQAVLYDGDEVIHSGVSLTNSDWYQFHAILYPETQQFALEVFADDGGAGAGAAIVVGFDDWVSTLDPRDVGTVDLFSFRDTNVTGLQNVGLMGKIAASDGPLYMDDLTISQNPNATTPVAVQWESKAHISFEANEQYTATTSLPGTNLVGQNGWTQGTWGTSTMATARDLSQENVHASDGDVAIRVAGVKAAVYKEISDVPITDDRVDVWFDSMSYGGDSLFVVGDDSMVLGDDGSGNLLTDGIAAMFGFGSNQFKAFNGDTEVSKSFSIAANHWYQFHAMLYLDMGMYALEIFDKNGNLVVGVDDWLAASSLSDMGDYDFFSFRDTTVDGIQNIGVCAETGGTGKPIYLDDILIQTPEEPIPGDANGDGKVDGSDVTILANNWQHGVTGTPNATWAMGDFNHDGKVDGSDVTILANNWQEGVSTAAAAVPEPSVLILLASISLTMGVIPRYKKPSV